MSTNDPLEGSVPLGQNALGQCSGGPSAAAWCGAPVTLVAVPVSGATPWFCCDAHTEGARTERVAVWLLHHDNHRVRTCDICAHEQICDKYDGWICAKCKQAYVYDETDPKLVLTDAQRALLLQHFEAHQ